MFSSTVLVARLGSDPELKKTKKGDFVCNLSVATSGKWLTKDGKEEEKTTWHKVVAWNKLAELCSSYLKKGRLILIEGEIVNKTWSDEDGVNHTVNEIKARKILFLDSKNK